jgi:hypothetical protein
MCHIFEFYLIIAQDQPAASECGIEIIN